MQAPSRLTFRPRPTSSIKRFTVCVIRVVRLGHPFCFPRPLGAEKLAMIHTSMVNKITTAAIVCVVLASTVLAQKQLTHQPIAVTIMQAEDERRWSNDLMNCFRTRVWQFENVRHLPQGESEMKARSSHSRMSLSVTLTRAFAQWPLLRSARSSRNQAPTH